MSTSEKPDPLLEEAFSIFMRGDWTRLGITGERETKLADRIRRYVSQGRTVPSHLLYWAREVWDEHRDEVAEVRTVFAADRACRFHATAGCGAFHRGQHLNDWDCDCWDLCNHRSPRLWALVERPLSEAIAQGKMPCRVCWPHGVSLPPSTDDFGHRPVNDYADVPLPPETLVRIVCARCITWTYQRDVDTYFGRRVSWPCTSAIVLGLAR